MFWTKIYPTKYDIVIAICDEELLDKEIGNKFKIKVSKEFYGGKLIDDKIAVRFMKRASVANLIGKNIVDLAEKNGFIIKENIIVIDEIPHAQFAKI